MGWILAKPVKQKVTRVTDNMLDTLDNWISILNDLKSISSTNVKCTLSRAYHKAQNLKRKIDSDKKEAIKLKEVKI